MRIIRHVNQVRRRLQRPVLTLGSYDGVHRGHQAIFRRVAETATAIGGTPVALTFDPHPAAVLRPEHVPLKLADFRTRAARITEHGIEVTIGQRFSQAFSQIGAEDFIERLLVGDIGVHSVIVGHRVSFGQGRRGGAALLQEFGERLGFDVEVIGPVLVEGVEVSSSGIRKAIAEGRLDEARSQLGYDPCIVGRVRQGDRRGRTLGFPTANLSVKGWAVPPNGVYAVEAVLDDRVLPGVANLGYKPTFGDNEKGLEVHLFDFDEDIYGERVEVRLKQQLRGEKKFSGPDELVAQIQRDLEAARAALD